MQTVLGTFPDRQTAQRAVDELLARGFARARVHLQTSSSAGGPEAQTDIQRGMMASVGHFFATLFDSDDKPPARNYAEAVRPGGSVVAVDTSDDSEVQTAESIMGLLGTLAIDDRAAQWKSERPNSELPRTERAGSAPNASGEDPDHATRRS